MRIELVDVILKASEYDRTKSITTAVDCAKQPLEANVVKGGDNEQ